MRKIKASRWHVYADGGRYLGFIIAMTANAAVDRWNQYQDTVAVSASKVEGKF